ncbi:MAG: putative integral membrane protein [Candidatus Pseudothioglobus sp.]|jgi:uncharacterized integral membrane protein
MAFLKKWSLRLLLLVVFVIVLVLATDNSQQVALSFLGYQSFEGPLSWWVIGAFALGMIFSMTLNVMTTTRLKLDVRRARNSAEQSLVALDKANATNKLSTKESATNELTASKLASDDSSLAPLSKAAVSST